MKGFFFWWRSAWPICFQKISREIQSHSFGVFLHLKSFQNNLCNSTVNNNWTLLWVTLRLLSTTRCGALVSTEATRGSVQLDAKNKVSRSSPFLGRIKIRPVRILIKDNFVLGNVIWAVLAVHVMESHKASRVRPTNWSQFVGREDLTGAAYLSVKVQRQRKNAL